MYEPIADYGIIGNLHTIALVSLKGSIDYMPFMRIDSPTIFLKLLDAEKGGYFSVCPTDSFTSKQRYITDTNVLTTNFFSDEGMAELLDYMPVNEKEFNCTVVRKLKGIRGSIRFSMKCAPVFNYAMAKHTIERENDNLLFIPEISFQTPLRLLSNIPLTIKETEACCDFVLNESETVFFVLEATHNKKQRSANIEEFVNLAYKATVGFWKSWISKSKYTGRWLEIVNRSALTLKLLISYKYGSVIAAPTFSLPESIGGQLNWDYRYTWIRDGALTMYVLLNLGFYDEADAFLEWIMHQCSRKQLQLMYNVDGESDLDEKILDHLEGYRGTAPVRIGNAAHRQFQLDIYGELMDTLYIFNQMARPITLEFWQYTLRQIDFVIENWQKPDHGIWEFRKEQKEFLYSRIMCWVALDRAIKIAENNSFPYPVLKWREIRDTILNDIYKNFWNKEKQCFVQYKNGAALDASVLIMPLVNFISPYSMHWNSTVKNLEKELIHGVLIYRYGNKKRLDGFSDNEGTFTMCSFWYIQCLAKAGMYDEAAAYFERMVSYANHLGLFSEQIGYNGELLGNFPHALTHLSLIATAIELSKEKHLRKKTLPPDSEPKMK
ncbi:glycoside hydrolase family 15 protein [Chitinophaga japonensis]|uniref:Pentatricopeptide repeat protein n=1 Tax=Chitinophaga japonensis TaxID=104662 RepID=A0A562SMT3_CHIJA|nr:glycoside hydrolase family 15 protein [Chitinophaga japonensis]TWI82607.1 pentatricopeptide repeat protein [Chitinophaga japonensis]